MSLSTVQIEALKGKYWLTRVLFLRCLGLMYAVAFLVALNQNESLIENINKCAGTGLAISLMVAVIGSANVPIMFALWALYFSIVTIGQRWYSFGWESQLLETGFLAMFMVPVLSLSKFPKYTYTPWVAIWGYRWLLFRIMIGAGMIKIRGDQCWRDLTCMNYHYQTQPNPNPFSIYFHNTPEWFHKLETMGNHIVELALPILLMIPHRLCLIAGGAVQILFQFVLIASGNLAFLNWLTALPAVMCFDDASLAWMYSQHDVERAIRAESHYRAVAASLNLRGSTNKSYSDHQIGEEHGITNAPTATSASATSTDTGTSTKAEASEGYTGYGPAVVSRWAQATILVRRAVTLAVGLWIAYLSYPVVNNILSPNQAMNASFDPFRIVNTYGAFGSITKVRHEVILQGTTERMLHDGTVWKDFEFTCKPGDINRRPCWISPYHLRIDWLMWFAAFQNYQQCPWLVHLADKLVSGDPITAQLLAPNGNPFNSTAVTDGAQQEKATVPTFVRAELYEYQYTSLDPKQKAIDAANGWEVGTWWKRRHVQSYLPPIERDNESVRKFLKAHRYI